MYGGAGFLVKPREDPILVILLSLDTLTLKKMRAIIHRYYGKAAGVASMYKYYLSPSMSLFLAQFLGPIVCDLDDEQETELSWIKCEDQL